MMNGKPSHESASGSEIERLRRRAARYNIVLDRVSIEALLRLDMLSATRKLEGVCRLIRAARAEELRLGFKEATLRIERCGGNVEEAIRRTLNGGAELHAGVAEMTRYAADRGLAYTPSTIHAHIERRGRGGTQRYIDKLADVMDAAAVFRIDCSQARAVQRLSRADEDAQRVIADFAAESRRRADRRRAECRVVVPPSALKARPNAFAGCGCPRCCERLAAHMQKYIAKMIAAPLFRDLDRDEARAEANLELVESVECWPGGNFTGWFAHRFANRARAIYRSRCDDERRMLSLDAAWVLTNDEGGRLIALGELVPDRTIDVLTIVILRERLAERALAVRRARAERSEEFTRDRSVAPESPAPPRSLRPLPPARKRTDPPDEQTQSDRRAA
jgi:hypothetical protein